MPVVLSSRMQKMLRAIIIIEEKKIIYYYKGEYWKFIARNANKYLNALPIMEHKYWYYPFLVQSQATSYTRTQNRRIMRLSNMSVV